MHVRVNRKALEAQDIVSFELVAVDGQALPAFSAGSHIDVHLRNGLTRQYSLCNGPQESHRYLIAVLKDGSSRGGSRAMHESVNENDVLRISPPKNHFGLSREAAYHLLLAGGIGVTPILCMAEHLATVGSAFEMHYCTRAGTRTAFFERIRASPFAPRVGFHFDDGEPAQKLDIHALVASPRPGTHLYVCGPKGFMDSVLGAARAAAWPEARLHYEYFAAEAADGSDDREFRVKLASSGRVIVVPKDKTVFQALSGAGVQVPTSCEQGVCGTCLTRVLEGIPDHRDVYLMPDERSRNDQFTPCCSRARTDMLVLDL